jgi:flagellar FliJ protein
MQSFKFPLQKALDVRASQLTMEEAKLQQAMGAIAAIDRERDIVIQARASAEKMVRGADSVPGEDLAALGAFRLRTQAEEKRLAAKRAQAEKAIEERRAAMLEARRRLKLLERLKERRRAEWQAAAAKEIEELASEAYLARWERGV